MAAPQRRVPPPNQQYYAVPQSPQASRFQPQSQPMPAPQPSTSQGPRNDTTYGVAIGAIGGGYGPYSVRFICSSLDVYGSLIAYFYFTLCVPPSTS